MATREHVVVIGASGFGREALDVLEAMRGSGDTFEIVGVVDDSPAQVNLDRLAIRGVEYLGTIDEWLPQSEGCRFVLGIGGPKVRRKLAEKLESAGLSAFTAIHPTATIGSCLSIGEGSVICARAVLSTNVLIKRHVHINPNATIGHDSVLDDFVSVNPGAIVSGEIVVGSEVLIGAGAIILQQLSVGYGALIGAGAVVTKSVPNAVVVKGLPGRW